MPLFRKNVQILSNITNIIYNNKFNVKSVGIKVPNTILTILDRTEFNNLKCNNNVKSRLEYYDNLIEDYKTIFENISVNLQFHFRNKVVFENGFDTMNITKMVRNFNISTKDIFLALTENNMKYEKYWDDTETNNMYKYFDYIGTYYLKCHLPSDDNRYDADTIISFRRYVERSGTRGIKRLLELFEEQIKKPEIIYKESEIICKESEIFEENNHIEKIEHLLIPDVLPKLQQYYCNNNFDNIYPLENNEKFSEYKDFYYKTMNTKSFNLSKYFKYIKKMNYNDQEHILPINSYTLVPLTNTSLENLSVSACIMFGDDNIRLCDVEQLLSCIRVKCDIYSYTIDNFTISTYDKHVLELCDDSETLNKIEFSQYDDFLNTCKWLIQVMNNMKPKNINHHNYGVLTKYCKNNDNFEKQRIRNLIYIEKRRIENCTF